MCLGRKRAQRSEAEGARLRHKHGRDLTRQTQTPRPAGAGDGARPKAEAARGSGDADAAEAGAAERSGGRTHGRGCGLLMLRKNAAAFLADAKRRTKTAFFLRILYITANYRCAADNFRYVK